MRVFHVCFMRQWNGLSCLTHCAVSSFLIKGHIGKAKRAHWYREKEMRLICIKNLLCKILFYLENQIQTVLIIYSKSLTVMETQHESYLLRFPGQSNWAAESGGSLRNQGLAAGAPLVLLGGVRAGLARFGRLRGGGNELQLLRVVGGRRRRGRVLLRLGG